MPNYVLHIISLLVFTYFFPDKVLDFLHTIRAWLDHRQALREAWDERVTVVSEATAQWASWVAAARTQLATERSENAKTDWLRQALAAGERYLMAVHPEEDPDVYRQTEQVVNALRLRLDYAKQKKGQACPA